VDDDWGDIPETPDPGSRMGRRAVEEQRRQGRSREQRFLITLGATAALALVVGIVIGMLLGRATAPKQPENSAAIITTATAEPATASVEPTITEVATESVQPTETAEATTPVEPKDTEAPDTPKQTYPDDGDRINADRVTLKWTKVTDDSGEPVTYAFEIETYASGKWGSAQVIKGLTKNSYSARVLQARRRWRVWAVDEAGNASPKSDWSIYRHTAVTTSKPATSTAGN
jgi:hypothetical protein